MIIHQLLQVVADEARSRLGVESLVTASLGR